LRFTKIGLVLCMLDIAAAPSKNSLPNCKCRCAISSSS
jgi:hypothetical protein